MRRTIGRSLVAVAIIGAGLALSSAPASAATYRHSVKVTNGTLTLTAPGGAVASIPLAAPGAFCGSTAKLLERTDAPDLTFDKVKITRRFSIGGASPYYVAEITASGHEVMDVEPVPGTTNGHRLRAPSSLDLRSDVYSAAEQGATDDDCDKAGARLCLMRFSHTTSLSWTSSTPLSASSPLTTAIASVAKIAVDPAAACNNALTAFDKGAHAITDLALEITATTRDTVVGGSLTTNLTPPLTVAMGMNPCPSDLSVTMATATSGTVWATMQPSFTYAGGTYVWRFPFSSAITVSGTAASLSSVMITGANIFNTSADDPCVAGTAKCGAVSMAAGSGLSGTFSGTVSPPHLNGTLVLSGVASIAAVGCTPPFSALNGKTLTLTGLTVVP